MKGGVVTLKCILELCCVTRHHADEFDLCRSSCAFPAEGKLHCWKMQWKISEVNVNILSLSDYFLTSFLVEMITSVLLRWNILVYWEEGGKCCSPVVKQNSDCLTGKLIQPDVRTNNLQKASFWECCDSRWLQGLPESSNGWCKVYMLIPFSNHQLKQYKN